MLKEFIHVRQEKKGNRRLFSDEDIDLYIWYDKSKKNIRGFQLVYGKKHDDMKAFTWEKDKGSSHARVDDEGWYNPTPVLAGESIFKQDMIAESFKEKSKALDKRITRLVLKKISEYTKDRMKK